VMLVTVIVAAAVCLFCGDVLWNALLAMHGRRRRDGGDEPPLSTNRKRALFAAVWQSGQCRRLAS
jgi:hypothetical protein